MRPPPPTGKPRVARPGVGIFLSGRARAGCLPPWPWRALGSGFRLAVLLAFSSALSLGASAAAAEVAGLRAERLVLPAGSAEGLWMEVRESADGGLDLRLRVRELWLPALDLRLGAVDWSCRATAPLTRCEGALRVAGRPAGRLAVDLSGALSADWRQGGRRLHLRQQGEGWQLDLARIPLAWLAAFWEARLGFAPDRGEASGRVRLPPAGGAAWTAELALAALGFDSADGSRAAADVGGRLQLRGDGERLALHGRWERGEALFAPFYVVAPEAGIDFAATLEADGPDLLLRDVEWRDGRRLQLHGTARRGGNGHWHALELAADSADLGALADDYLQGVLGAAGLAGLELRGAARLQLRLDREGLLELAAELEAVDAEDPAGRFAVGGGSGDLRWSRHAAPASALSWQAARVYGIDLGPARLAFRSREGLLELAEPAAIDLLGGRLLLSPLAWRPARGAAAATFRFGLALYGLDLGRLSRQFGWPPFEGRLDGALPEANYSDGRLVFEGGLRMDLFGGRVRIDGLALERPFGVAPSLAADVRFDDIDLAPLTRAFGFGEITGRLDGRIRDLRLLDWTPVAFDARLLSDRRWPGRRRISQRAVQDIADLGGRGLIAGLQARLLRTFDDFGYERIAIGCVLRDHVCRMSGIARRGEGFLIVEGRGLPRIEVIGFHRDVDWPLLVERLQAATAGGGVRID